MKTKLLIAALLFLTCLMAAQTIPQLTNQVLISVNVTGFVANPDFADGLEGWQATPAAEGSIRVAVRQPHLAHTMRLMGDVGQVEVVQANVRDEASVRRALAGARRVRSAGCA